MSTGRTQLPINDLLHQRTTRIVEVDRDQVFLDQGVGDRASIGDRLRENPHDATIQRWIGDPHIAIRQVARNGEVVVLGRCVRFADHHDAAIVLQGHCMRAIQRARKISGDETGGVERVVVGTVHVQAHHHEVDRSQGDRTTGHDPTVGSYDHTVQGGYIRARHRDLSQPCSIETGVQSSIRSEPHRCRVHRERRHSVAHDDKFTARCHGQRLPDGVPAGNACPRTAIDTEVRVDRAIHVESCHGDRIIHQIGSITA